MHYSTQMVIHTFSKTDGIGDLMIEVLGYEIQYFNKSKRIRKDKNSIERNDPLILFDIFKSFQIDKADPPFPRPAGYWWFGCSQNEGIVPDNNANNPGSSNNGAGHKGTGGGFLY